MLIAPAWQLSHAAAAHKDKVLYNAWRLAGIPISLLYECCSIHTQERVGMGKGAAERKAYAVRFAIDVGYCHFDCAYLYQNESEIGNAIWEKIKEGVVRWKDLSIVSKVSLRRRGTVPTCKVQTLAALQMDYLDLHLMHWPMGFKVLRLLNHGSNYHPGHIPLRAWDWTAICLCRIKQLCIT
uniref:NADP-dependent oxidoreductase domain-containing protein n=1 Tax=Amazona collaria TaxID=241587 RepID=A0A8B9GJZ0_9PSIT